MTEEKIYHDKSYRWGCYVPRDECLLIFLIVIVLEFVSLLFTKVWAWLNAPCLCLLSLSSSQGKSPPPVARLWERFWDQEDISAVQSLLEDTLIPCSRLNIVLVCHVKTIVVY